MKFVKLLFLLVLPLTACSGESEEESGGGYVPGTGVITSINESTSSSEEIFHNVDSIQDVPILHAWNWKVNDVKARLDSIKKAGYGAVQLSPLQPKLDGNNWSSESTSSQWWKLYQPLGFKISEGNESFLGTKEDLVSLCNEAKKYDIKIVMDIVANHLAGKDNNYTTDQVYIKYPLHTLGIKADDNNGQSVVQGHIGLPDLDTSNKQVQNDVLAMLKDYLDCGVSGFRFDAAKHIETPDDGDYRSDFWPTVLDGTSAYAKEKGYATPYYYGEILNTCGAGRSFSSYTKMMSIVDNKQGTSIVQAVHNNNLGGVKTTYDTGESPDHLVLWAESHDTYANTSGYDLTTSFPSSEINKAYIIQTSRKDAASLYFARPSNMGVTICSIDDYGGWKNREIASVNVFHQLYVDQDESISTNNNCFVNVRGAGESGGATIVNFGSSESANVEVKGLANGVYTDIISMKDVTVSSETANVSFTNDACILLPKELAKDLDFGDVTYDSNVVIKGADVTKSYLAWTWTNNIDGAWKAFVVDHDAIGLNLSVNMNYVIVEFPSGTTVSSADWNNKIKQTNDLKYNGGLVIHNYSSLSWK